MVQQMVVVIESEEKRADDAFASRVAKPANDTIGRAQVFNFHRRGAFA